MSWNTEGSSVTKVMHQAFQQTPSHQTIFSSLSAATVKGNVAPLGVGVKSEESSTFLLAGNVMVTLARTSNKQLIIVVRKISASRLARYQCYDID